MKTKEQLINLSSILGRDINYLVAGITSEDGGIHMPVADSQASTKQKQFYTTETIEVADAYEKAVNDLKDGVRQFLKVKEIHRSEPKENAKRKASGTNRNVS